MACPENKCESPVALNPVIQVCSIKLKLKKKTDFWYLTSIKQQLKSSDVNFAKNDRISKWISLVRYQLKPNLYSNPINATGYKFRAIHPGMDRPVAMLKSWILIRELTPHQGFVHKRHVAQWPGPP